MVKECFILLNNQPILFHIMSYFPWFLSRQFFLQYILDQSNVKILMNFSFYHDVEETMNFHTHFGYFFLFLCETESFDWSSFACWEITTWFHTNNCFSITISRKLFLLHQKKTHCPLINRDLFMFLTNYFLYLVRFQDYDFIWQIYVMMRFRWFMER